jgi:hypothetical protein
MKLIWFSATVGGSFFNENPYHTVTGLFVYMKDMRYKQTRANELLASRGYIDFTDKMKEVEQLGCVDASKRRFSLCSSQTTLILTEIV